MSKSVEQQSGSAVLVCNLCGSPIEFIDDEQVWRHKGNPLSEGFRAQIFCPKYGYPVQPAHTSSEWMKEFAYELVDSVYLLTKRPYIGDMREREAQAVVDLMCKHQSAAVDEVASLKGKLAFQEKIAADLFEQLMKEAGPEWAGNEILTIRAMREKLACKQPASATFSTEDVQRMVNALQEIANDPHSCGLSKQRASAALAPWRKA